MQISLYFLKKSLILPVRMNLRQMSAARWLSSVLTVCDMSLLILPSTVTEQIQLVYPFSISGRNPNNKCSYTTAVRSVCSADHTFSLIVFFKAAS